MTQQELDSLPEMGGIGEEPVPDRPGWVRPVVRPNFVLWSHDDDPIAVTDSQGLVWSIGWYNGVKYKRRFHAA